MHEEHVTIAAGTEQHITKLIETATEAQRLTITIEKDATADVQLAFIQGEPALYDVQLVLAGEGASLKLGGMVIGAGEQQPTMNIDIHHEAPGTTANVVFRGVLTDTAKQDWKGMIKIAKGAQGTNSWLEDRTLLLSPKARAHAIPSLEIEANDVHASHAATVGKLDPTSVFYLMSRGLDRSQAEELIVEGFLRPVMPAEDDIKDRLERVIKERLIHA